MTYDDRHPNHPARMYSPVPLLDRFPGRGELDIASRLGVDLSTVHAWRRGGRVRAHTARRIAANLGSTVSDIWFPAVLGIDG